MWTPSLAKHHYRAPLGHIFATFFLVPVPIFLHRHPRLVNSLQMLGSSHLITTTPDAPGILTVVDFDNSDFEARRSTNPKCTSPKCKSPKPILPPPLCRDVPAILPREHKKDSV